MDGKTRNFYNTHQLFNEKTRHSHKRLSENTVKKCVKISTRLRNCLPQTATHKHIITHICAKYATNTYKTWDLRPLGAKVNGKTRDFWEVRAILNEKTRHSHKTAIGKACKNACKSHLIYANKYKQNMGLTTAGGKNGRKNTRLLWCACNFERENTTFP